MLLPKNHAVQASFNPQGVSETQRNEQESNFTLYGLFIKDKRTLGSQRLRQVR